MVLMTLYADDLHLTKPIKDARDYISLQEDITAIANHIEKLHATEIDSTLLRKNMCHSQCTQLV